MAWYMCQGQRLGVCRHEFGVVYSWGVDNGEALKGMPFIGVGQPQSIFWPWHVAASFFWAFLGSTHVSHMISWAIFVLVVFHIFCNVSTMVWEDLQYTNPQPVSFFQHLTWGAWGDWPPSDRWRKWTSRHNWLARTERKKTRTANRFGVLILRAFSKPWYVFGIGFTIGIPYWLTIINN